MAESTQQAYQDNSIRVLQEMIDTQVKYLDQLMKSQAAPQVIESVSKTIEDLERKLLHHQSNTSNNNNGGTNPFDLDRGFNGHPPNRIMPMDSDYEDNGEGDGAIYCTPCDEDGLNNNNSSSTVSSKSPNSTPTTLLSATSGAKYSKYLLAGKSKRDSKTPLPPSQAILDIELINVNSLRISRYLVNNQVSPNALLFYTVAKHIFPKLVNNMFCVSHPAAKQIVQRWANQIVATWILKDSPLFFLEFPSETLDQFDKNLSGLINTSLPNIFEPFLEKVKELVQKDMADYYNAVSVKPELLSTSAKYDLQACIETLLLAGSPAASGLVGKLDIREMDSTMDQFVSHVNARHSGHIIALISSLLTVGHYIFGITSKHILLSDLYCSAPIVCNTIPSITSLNPVLKLSSEGSKKSNQKRASVVSVNSGVSLDSTLSAVSVGGGKQYGGGVMEYGHYYQPVREMNKIMYCSICLAPFWGEYNYICGKCLITAHLWCRKDSAESYPCQNVDSNTSLSGMHTSQSFSVSLRSKESGAKNRQRSKSDKKSVFEKITGKTFQKPDSSGHLNKSDSSISATSSESLTTSDSSSDNEDLPAKSIESEQQQLIHNQAFNDNRR